MKRKKKTKRNETVCRMPFQNNAKRIKKKHIIYENTVHDTNLIHLIFIFKGK